MCVHVFYFVHGTGLYHVALTSFRTGWPQTHKFLSASDMNICVNTFGLIKGILPKGVEFTLVKVKIQIFHLLLVINTNYKSF